MNEALQTLLNAILPTYYDVLPVGVTSGITYTLMTSPDIAYESGAAMLTEDSYMVRVFLPAETYSQSTVNGIRAALRSAGWATQGGPLMLDDAKTHYMYPIEITKRSLIT